MRIGVLGLQGDVAEHAAMLRGLADVVIVKKASELETIDGLIIPGGESTTIGKLIQKYEIDRVIKHKRLPVFGTCAGAILLAKKILAMAKPVHETCALAGAKEQFSLKLIDVTVERNAYGRQKESFEADLEIPALGKPSFRGIFIRAPVIRKCGNGVEVLAEHEGGAVLARQGKILVATFHPELTRDARVHEYFIKLITEG